MKILDEIKKFLFGQGNNWSEEDSAEYAIEYAARIAQETAKPKVPDMSVYETRRPELQESDEMIEGIFYLIDGKIVPDYYSECLITDKDNLLRKQMYHRIFYANYICRKFSGLSGCGENFLPRGRILPPIPFIALDKCFICDEDIITQLRELYHLPETVKVIDNKMYRCPACMEHETAEG